MPTFEIGADTVIKLGSAGAPNTVVDKKSYFKALKFNEQVGQEDITTLGPTDYAKLFGYLLNEMDFNADVLYDAAFWKYAGDIIRARKKVSLEIYPRGETSGYEKLSCTVMLVNRDRNLGVGEFDKGTLALKRTGTIVEGTVA